MFSKLKVLIVLSFLALAGCGLEIGESPAPEGEVRLEGYSCVNQISERVGEYFAGDLSEGQITEFVGCLKKSVSDFTRLMRRNPQDGVYNPEDLRIFINRIAKERELTPELLAEFMKIKQTFVGGRTDQISVSDLSAALNLLDDIEQAALILRPHVKIFNAELSGQISPERIAIELDQSSEALKQVLRIFISSLKASEKEYSLTDFEGFLEEFRKFIKWYEVFPDGRPAKDWIELVASAKEISTGGDRYVIKKNEWEPFLLSSQSVFIAFLKIKYGVTGQDLWQGIGLKNLIHVVDHVRDEVVQIISSRKDRLIPKQEVVRLIEALGKMDWLPFGLDAQLWTHGLELFTSQILDERQQGEFLGYRVSHLLKLGTEFESWASAQTFMTESIVPSERQSRTPSQPTPQVFMDQGAPSSVINHKEPEVIPLSWSEFENFMRNRRPLFMPDSRKVAITYERDLQALGVDYDLHNLSLTHMFYRILKLVYGSYGVRGEDGQFKLSGARLQQFYSDFFQVGVGLKWLDQRSGNAGGRSYVEGNLFTYASDGMSSEYSLSLSEGVDLIAYLLTAGQLTDGVYQALSGCRAGAIDFRGQAKIERSCVNQNLVGALTQVLDFAPALRKWLMRASENDLRQYTDLLMASAFSKTHSDPVWFEKSELSTIAVVILYSESVLTRFDKNQNQRLSNSEVLEAFPIFNHFIKNLSGDSTLSDGRTRAIYEFILHHRRAPSTFKDWLSLKWNSPVFAGASDPIYPIDSDRLALTEAFSVIINGLLNGAPPKNTD